MREQTCTIHYHPKNLNPSIQHWSPRSREQMVGFKRPLDFQVPIKCIAGDYHELGKFILTDEV